MTLRRMTLGGLLALLAATGVAAPLQAGDMAPPLLGQTRDADPVHVSDFAGKVVVVTFWATWCPYCIKELPILENVQNKVGKDRIAATNGRDANPVQRLVQWEFTPWVRLLFGKNPSP